MIITARQDIILFVKFGLIYFLLCALLNYLKRIFLYNGTLKKIILG